MSKMEFLKNQCYFCGELDGLMSMDTNSLIIDSVYIDFVQLIFELMQVKVCDSTIVYIFIFMQCILDWR